jgi:hypothetical protein
LIVIINVDGILIYGRSKDEIDDFIKRMKTEDVTLNKESTAEVYLGVDIQWYGRQLTITQVGLTKQIIEALGLNLKFLMAVATPAKKSALGRDLKGPPARGQVNCETVIGMLLCLGHSHP